MLRKKDITSGGGNCGGKLKGNFANKQGSKGALFRTTSGKGRLVVEELARLETKKGGRLTVKWRRNGL